MTLSREELERIRESWVPGKGSTHYESCYENHYTCAIHKLLAYIAWLEGYVNHQHHCEFNGLSMKKAGEKLKQGRVIKCTCGLDANEGGNVR